MRQHIFHGGCGGCTQQNEQPLGIGFCVGCQYFGPDWSLPNLSKRPQAPAPTQEEIEHAAKTELEQEREEKIREAQEKAVKMLALHIAAGYTDPVRDLDGILAEIRQAIGSIPTSGRITHEQLPDVVRKRTELIEHLDAENTRLHAALRQTEQ